LLGGISVSLLGIPRTTYDIDYLVELDNPRDIEKFSLILERKKLHNEVYKGDIGEPIYGIVRTSVGGIQVDFIIASKTWEYEAIQNSYSIKIKNTWLSIISPEYLIISKLKAGSIKDFYDVKELLRVIKFKKKELDKLKTLAEKYRVNSKLERIMKA
jgi:hypothetical protein